MNVSLKALSQLVLLVALLAPLSVLAQQSAPAKPYHDGPVWDISTIRVKYGMEERYLNFLAGDWKKEQEAMKKAGYILDYKVITTEPHSPQDFNVILLTEFKDLATLEANSEKMEAMALELLGGRPKVEAAVQGRADYREVTGDRLGREIILEPKPAK